MTGILVLGAGVVGLTSAVKLQDTYPHAQITVIAAGWETETTSSGAGGLFRMTEGHCPGNDLNMFRQWTKDAWDFWQSKMLTPEAPQMGIIPVTLHNVSREYTPRQIFAEYCFSYEDMTREQAQVYGPQYNHGFIAGTVVTDCGKFLKWLTNRFTSRGGRCIRKKLNSLDDIPTDYDVVVNCTGLGSRWLFNDDKVYPVRGETVRVHAPWMKQCVIEESAENTYIIVLPDCVVVGGCRQKNDHDLTLRDGQDSEMLERAVKLYPPLKGAKVIKRWVGLRPYREPLRVERETINIRGKSMEVVHNYGHGGFGVCLSWGTACHAARLVQEVLGGAKSKL